MGRENLGPLLDQRRQRLDDGGDLSFSKVDLRQQEDCFGIIRVQRNGFLQAGDRFAHVVVVQMRQGQLVFRQRRARIDSAHALELSDRLGRFTPGQLDTAAQQVGLIIGGVLRENPFDQLFTVVVLALAEGNFGQACPGRNIIRGFLRDFIEQLPGGGQVTILDFEIAITTARLARRRFAANRASRESGAPRRSSGPKKWLA